MPIAAPYAATNLKESKASLPSQNASVPSAAARSSVRCLRHASSSREPGGISMTTLRAAAARTLSRVENPNPPRPRSLRKRPKLLPPSLPPPRQRPQRHPPQPRARATERTQRLIAGLFRSEQPGRPYAAVAECTGTPNGRCLGRSSRTADTPSETFWVMISTMCIYLCAVDMIPFGTSRNAPPPPSQISTPIASAAFQRGKRNV